jgi:hypothetical protein
VPRPQWDRLPRFARNGCQSRKPECVSRSANTVLSGSTGCAVSGLTQSASLASGPFDAGPTQRAQGSVNFASRAGPSANPCSCAAPAKVNTCPEIQFVTLRHLPAPLACSRTRSENRTAISKGIKRIREPLLEPKFLECSDFQRQRQTNCPRCQLKFLEGGGIEPVGHPLLPRKMPRRSSRRGIRSQDRQQICAPATIAISIQTVESKERKRLDEVV